METKGFMEELVESVQTDSVQAAVNLANQEFIKGFVAGQIILCVLIFFLVKIFLLRGSRETRIELIYRQMHRLPVRIPIAKKTTDSFILSKLGHDSQRTESCEWLSLLVARILSEYRDNGRWKHAMMSRLDSILNASPSDYMSPITITDFNLGDEFPVFQNASAQLCQEKLDQISLGVDTSVLVNWPKPGIASLPISLNISVTEFAGTIRLEIEPGSSSSPPYVCFSLLESCHLELEVKSLLGHRTKIKDLPKITTTIIRKIKTAFTQECIWPKMQKIPLPTVLDSVPVLSDSTLDEPTRN